MQQQKVILTFKAQELLSGFFTLEIYSRHPRNICVSINLVLSSKQFIEDNIFIRVKALEDEFVISSFIIHRDTSSFWMI